MRRTPLEHPDDRLIARLRPRDYDIKEALEKLDLAPGELSDMVRDGMRLVLRSRGYLFVKNVDVGVPPLKSSSFGYRQD